MVAASSYLPFLTNASMLSATEELTDDVHQAGRISLMLTVNVRSEGERVKVGDLQIGRSSNVTWHDNLSSTEVKLTCCNSFECFEVRNLETHEALEVICSNSRALYNAYKGRMPLYKTIILRQCAFQTHHNL